MVVTVELDKVAVSSGIGVVLGDMKTQEGEALDANERRAIELALNYIKRVYARISPKLAMLFDTHKQFVLSAASVYKRKALKANVAADFDFPPKLGRLAVAPIAPQLIRYVATPSATDPAYSDYALNSFTIMFGSAGETKYLFGSDANYWKGLSETKGPIMHVVFEDGLIEIGTSPKVDQIYIEFDGWNMLGTFFQPEAVKLPIEESKPVYQYTHPAFVTIPDRGIKVAVLGEVAGDSILVPVGVTFYFVDKFKTLTWIS